MNRVRILLYYVTCIDLSVLGFSQVHVPEVSICKMHAKKNVEFILNISENGHYRGSVVGHRVTLSIPQFSKAFCMCVCVVEAHGCATQIAIVRLSPVGKS